MAYGDISSVNGAYEFLDADTDSPMMVHVAGTVYAIACQKASLGGWIYTVNITSAGVISSTGKDPKEFEAATIQEIYITKIANNTFAILTGLLGAELKLRTVQIANDGEITIGAVTREIDAADTIWHWMCETQGSVGGAKIYAIVHAMRKISTVAIADDGTIGSVIQTFEFDTAGGDHPVIIHISGTIFAIVYSYSGSVKKIATVNITSAGVISATGKPIRTISTTAEYTSMSIQRAIDNTFVVAYRGPDNDGFVGSITIDNEGNINDGFLAEIEFDENDPDFPHMLSIGLGYCILVYRDKWTDGFARSFKVAAGGSFGTGVLSTLEFDPEQGSKPKLLHIGGDIYVVVYQGTASDGFVKALNIGTPVTGRPGHLMMMGIG